MSFVPFPIFIGGREFTSKEYLVLVLGLGLSLGMVLPISFHFIAVDILTSSCEPIKPSDSGSLLAWKNSCFTFEYNTSITIPIIVSIGGWILLSIGLGRYYYEKRKTGKIE